MTALPSSTIKHAEHARNSWQLTVPSDIPYDELLKPETWIHHSTRMGLKDFVEVWAEDMSWVAEFRVLDKGAFGVKMGGISGKKEFGIAVPDESLPAGYTIKYNGPELRYCITRTSDNKRIHHGLPDKGAAAEWIRNFTKKAA